MKEKIRCLEKMEPDPRDKVKEQEKEEAVAIPGRKGRGQPVARGRAAAGATGAGRATRAPGVAAVKGEARRAAVRAPDDGAENRLI
jgi:hypothetical protein